VLRVLRDKPDAVFVIAVGTTSVMPHLALISNGYKGKIYHTGGVANAEFLRVGGKQVEGAFVPSSPVLIAEQLPDGYPTKAEALRFIQAYEPKFGPRSTFASSAWDALLILKAAAPEALKKAQPGTPAFREALRTAIENVKGLRGAMAVHTFSPSDHSGVDQLGMAVVRVENGSWKLEDYAKFN
jgi:branched-chain amino acid transport system substrate-binding protein